MLGRSIRANLTSDLAKAMAEGRLSVHDTELAADILIGIWLQVTRGTLQRRPTADLGREALDAALRAVGALPEPQRFKKSGEPHAAGDKLGGSG